MMQTGGSNIALIGMPGVGKSTVGELLAANTGRRFIDTDRVIERAQGCRLQELMDRDGLDAFCRIEEETLLGLDIDNDVIATGGSAVYSDAAMDHLRTRARVIFLDLDLDTLQNRIHDPGERGLALKPGQDLADLYAERRALYSRHAHLHVQCAGLGPGQLCEKIIACITT